MYNASGIKDKEQCLREYAPLVRRLAHQMMTRLPCSVQLDDIIQAGMIGLLDAATRYDEFHGAQFETYATQRIRGAMLDELRAADWLPRNLRRDMRRIEAAISRLQHKLGRPPNETEIAKELDVPLAEYQQMLLDSRGAQLCITRTFRAKARKIFLSVLNSVVKAVRLMRCKTNGLTRSWFVHRRSARAGAYADGDDLRTGYEFA